MTSTPEFDKMALRNKIRAALYPELQIPQILDRVLDVMRDDPEIRQEFEERIRNRKAQEKPRHSKDES